MNQIQVDYDKAARRYKAFRESLSDPYGGVLDSEAGEAIAAGESLRWCREKLLAWALPILMDRHGNIPAYERDQIKQAMEIRLVATGTH